MDTAQIKWAFGLRHH